MLASYIAGSRLRPIARITFAAALAVGLVTAPTPQLISAATLQQQASAPAKKAKMKKSQLLDSARRVSGRRSTMLNGRKRKPPARLKREPSGEVLERLQQASQVSFQIVCIKNFQTHKQTTNANSENTEGVGETRSLADALECHPEPGRRGATVLR
jgi:hypothetical protein